MGPQSKIKLDQKLTIGHIICLLLYSNYYSDFVRNWIREGMMKLSADEDFNLCRSRNEEISNFCRLLNEAIFCFGDMLKNEDRLYYNLTRRLPLRFLSMERNVPISTTSSFQIARRFHQQRNRGQRAGKGMILRLGKFQNAKEYNYVIRTQLFSNMPMENEAIVYGGKFEINDII